MTLFALTASYELAGLFGSSQLMTCVLFGLQVSSDKSSGCPAVRHADGEVNPTDGNPEEEVGLSEVLLKRVALLLSAWQAGCDHRVTSPPSGVVLTSVFTLKTSVVQMFCCT